MDYIRTTTYTAIILLLCTYVSFAQETNTGIKVKLAIETADEITEQTVESCISRELMSLGNVTIVDTREDCLIGIMIMENKTLSGSFALSVVFYERQDVYGLLAVRGGMEKLRKEIRELPETEQQKELLASSTMLLLKMVIALLTIGDYSIKDHFMYVGVMDKNLRKCCEQVIVQFNNSYLKEKKREEKRREKL